MVVKIAELIDVLMTINDIFSYFSYSIFHLKTITFMRVDFLILASSMSAKNKTDTFSFLVNCLFLNKHGEIKLGV